MTLTDEDFARMIPDFLDECPDLYPHNSLLGALYREDLLYIMKTAASAAFHIHSGEVFALLLGWNDNSAFFPHFREAVPERKIGYNHLRAEHFAELAKAAEDLAYADSDDRQKMILKQRTSLKHWRRANSKALMFAMTHFEEDFK